MKPEVNPSQRGDFTLANFRLFYLFLSSVQLTSGTKGNLVN